MATKLTKSDIARLLGMKGASKGGHARAKVLSASKRRAIAKKAASARWAKAKKRRRAAA